MKKILPIILIASSIVVASTLNVPAKTFQLVALTLMVFTIIITSRFFKDPNSKILNIPLPQLLYVLVLATSLLLVLGSGGIFSPFLVLIHVVTFGIGIAVSFSVATAYLIISVLSLAFGIALSPVIRAEFLFEPWIVAINIVSMATLLPIIYIALNRFHLREFVLQQLQEQVALSEIREDIITQNLKESIVVCNKELLILSANHRFRQMTGMEAATLTLQSLFSVVKVWDDDKDPVTTNNFDITHVIEGTETLMKSGYYIQGRAMDKKRRVDIHIRPVIGTTQNVEQIVCVITNAKTIPAFTKRQTHEHIFEPLEAHVEEIVHHSTNSGNFFIKKRATLLLEHIRDASSSLTIRARIGETPTITDLETVLRMATHELKQYLIAFPYHINMISGGSIPVVSTDPVHQKILPSQFLSEKYTALIDGPSAELLIRKLICIIVGHMTEAKITEHTITCSIDSDDHSVYIVCSHDPTVEITHETTAQLMESAKQHIPRLVCSGYELKIIDAIAENESITIHYGHSGAILISIPRE